MYIALAFFVEVFPYNDLSMVLLKQWSNNYTLYLCCNQFNNVMTKGPVLLREKEINTVKLILFWLYTLFPRRMCILYFALL